MQDNQVNSKPVIARPHGDTNPSYSKYPLLKVIKGLHILNLSRHKQSHTVSLSPAGRGEAKWLIAFSMRFNLIEGYRLTSPRVILYDCKNIRVFSKVLSEVCHMCNHTNPRI